ncbi:hypothetical protein PILCRDRAFT_9162 [Piloderma croceum F 1598]|uniref:Methyltransferase type 11 domain-containing protein n=1 Tax=Piloderma croceum (strain F 1598) TaxID=765440 RepID=A0A0C3FN83_PILCF|nr:hypothetical protein PILCRDRAFT_9162 [Piloderma croceum F 1598]
MPKTSVTPAQIENNPQAHEDQHVHAVYDKIASHFSSTRYKPWPIIAHFLSTLSTGSVGLDAGTGNGKYLPLPLDRPPGSICTIGLDRSRNLLEIARTAGADVDEASTIKCMPREVIWGDVIGKGWRDGAFDYAISIATIHHLATHDRRKLAVKRLLQCVSPSRGRILIYVWAIEQDELSRRSVPTESYTKNDSLAESGMGPGRDVFVPWVLSRQNTNNGKLKGKLSKDPLASRSNVTDSTQSCTNGTSIEVTLMLGPDEPQVFNRYYHMFAEGELVELVRSAAGDLGIHIGPIPDQTLSSGPGMEWKGRGLEIVQDGWERSNYYVELRCWEK